MKDTVRVDGATFEVHKPLDAILEEKVPNFKAPPEHTSMALMRDPILQALAANFSEIRDAEALRVNQLKLDIAVNEAARTQGISAETLSQILERVSERSETTARRLLEALQTSGPPPPPPPGGVSRGSNTDRVATRTTADGPDVQTEDVGTDPPPPYISKMQVIAQNSPIISTNQ